MLSVLGQGEIESTTESALYEKAVLSNRETFDGKGRRMIVIGTGSEIPASVFCSGINNKTEFHISLLETNFKIGILII